MLLDLGMSPDVEKAKTGLRPLVTAAYHGATRVTQLLIERGAEVDFGDNDWDATPMQAANWGGKPQTADLLAKVTRSPWPLVTAGKIERLREIIAAEPRLARVSWQSQTPLFWLPDDERVAVEIIELFRANGADPTLRNRKGESASDRARRRGMEDAATALDGGKAG